MNTLRIAALVVLASLGRAEFRAAAQNTPTFALAPCKALPEPTEMHGSAVIGNRLYLFGGRTGAGYVRKVISSEISDTGALDVWRTETPMPDLRAYIGNGVQVVNNRIYVCGGTTTTIAFATDSEIHADSSVVWTTVRPDGTLENWRKSDPFSPRNWANVATCSTDEHLYVLGGNSNEAINNQVLICDFAQDGTPQNWRECATMPEPRWFHGAAILDGRMYVWGGLKTRSNSETNPRVVSAEVRSDGSLGSWRGEAAMGEAVYSAAYCGFNDYLICVGGRTKGGMPTESIWFARLQNGAVGEWQKLSSDLQSRVYHTLGLDRSRGRIYVSGGRFRGPRVTTGGNLVAAVQAFQLESSGDKVPSATHTVPAADTEAIRESLSAGKRVLLYFHSPEVPAVRRFEESVLKTQEFADLTRGYDVQSVDSSRDKVFSYAYAVFRVPSVAVLEPDGGVRRSGMLQSADDLREFLDGK